MGGLGGGEGPYRGVSLYWCEKLWLLLDGLQLLAILLSALQPSLPYGWNVWARLTSLFLFDITGLLRVLPTTNELGPYPLDASARGFVLLLVLLMVVAAAAAWPRAVYAQELYQREQELEKLRKEQELQRLRRPSQARPSVTAMLALSQRPAPPSFLSRCRTAAQKLWARVVVMSYFLLGKLTRLRAALALFLLPAFLAIELPLIFCSDQADACASSTLLVIRIASCMGVVALLFHSVRVLLHDAKEAAVARQGRQQEEYLKQREIEYLLFLNNDWMDKKVWLVSSFKGGLFRTYFRLWLLLLKSALLVSSALLGQVGSRPPTALGWLASVGRKRDAAAAAAAAAQAASGTLGEAIIAEPLGRAARTAVAAALVLSFCLIAVFLPPFRCRSSNCVHLTVFLHLGGISGIGLAAAGADAKRNSFLLYSNQHLLLAVVHFCSLSLLLGAAAWCCLRCLTPTESPLLERYEVMLGYTGCSGTRKGADSRGTFAALCHNVALLSRLWWRRSLSHFLSSDSSYSSWSSGSGSTLEIGETAIREKDYNLQPFEAPWPTRPQHARFWLRVAPRLVEQLAASRVLLQRYAAAEKQLIPVHLTNAAFRELEALVVQHIGAVEQRDTRRRSRRQSRKKTLSQEPETLEQLLQELGAGQPAAKTQAAPGTLSDAWRTTKNEELGGSVREGGQQEEGFVFRQQRQGTDESLWSVDSAAEAATAAAAAAMPQALAFRQLEKAAHLSAEFPHAKLTELQDLKTIIKAVEWTVAEVFEKMSGKREEDGGLGAKYHVKFHVRLIELKKGSSLRWAPR